MNLNKVQVIGRITKKPELRQTPGGTKVCSFSVATNRTYVVDGAKREETEFIDVTTFGKQAETIEKWFDKGDEIYVEGRLKKSSWTKKDGSKGYRTDVIMEKFEFGQKVGKKKESAAASPEEEGPVPDDVF